MDEKQANIEITYRVIKIVLSEMRLEGLITDHEFEAARQNLVSKLKPLIGSLE